MSLENFIPEIWSARLLANLHMALVYGQEGVINRDYEGEIQNAGDTVRINSIGAVTVSDYTKNTNISDPEDLSDNQRALLIDKQKYFNFQVDDVDKVQQTPKVMDEAMMEAGFALAKVADTVIASKYVDADGGNLIGSDGSPITITPATAYDYLVDLGVLLTEANVPELGRFVVVPAWFDGMLRKDERFVSFGTAENVGVRSNGRVGRVSGLDVLVSNNVPNTTATKYKIIAGHRIAWSFAEQITKTEAYRPEKRFADAVKGLHVYGVKVVRPKALAVLTANRS
jgi:hypothetical protein